MATKTTSKKKSSIEKVPVNTIKNKRPRGYLSHNEFWDLAKQDLDKLCVDYGIL